METANKKEISGKDGNSGTIKQADQSNKSNDHAAKSTTKDNCDCTTDVLTDEASNVGQGPAVEDL